MSDLGGKVALITGAKGGLGSFVTKAFLEAGASVVGVSRSIAASDFNHPRFAAIPAELSSGKAVETALDETVSRFGRVDVVVHLMGGWAGGSRLEDTDAATFDHMIDMNLRSTFFVMKAAARRMRAQRSGRLLAIGSTAALQPQPQAGAYSVSKSALVALMRAFAFELRDAGVTANILLPSTMDTPQNRAAMPGADSSRWVPPGQVAEMLAFLASDAASAISGAAIPIFGAEI
jgi:NAD(P)-dependent dehydrogenase (short-subunit alcohol dehydrogenase family)